MLEDNGTAFSEAEIFLFWPKYEELVAKLLSQKTDQKNHG